MKTTLLAVQNKLKEVADLNYIDEDTGQLDNYSPHPPVQWPCALIDFTGGTFSNIGIDNNSNPINRQMGEETLTITIANLKLSPGSAKASNQQRENAFAIWDIIEDVHSKIHGWSPGENAGKFIRTRRGRVRRDDGIQEYIITYTLGLSNV